MTTSNASLKRWVDDVARLTQPASIHWCNGSDAENTALIEAMLKSGDLIKLNQDTHPNCYLHRSHPSDVARVEHLTFVCTRNKEDAGPNNHWMDPTEAHRKIDGLFAGAMRGRTMYVIPYCMGPIDSPFARCGVEITDSPYVVVNMRLMTRMGDAALTRIEREDKYVKGLHSIGDLDPDRRFIMHFPEELTIKSVGSGYGGNALLGKKCHALRIASWQAREEGWLAEHMLLMGLQSPEGRTHYVAAAFPSACGKTNLAMLVPPASMPGWKIWTLGDDISWLHVDEQGQLRAINPESGYFGVVPGTNRKTNCNAYDMIQRDTIFTNVALTADNQPWWEGLENGTPVLDWQGKPYTPGNGPAAHPNSRFTVSAKQNPIYSTLADAPEGVPISAILFGGRRREVAPLVYEARDWAHGVLVGAGMASETTAAAVGQMGVVRRDSMAMKPFAGYNFADYWSHWLKLGSGANASKLPKIFHVNWFRQDRNGRFMWPGFGENLRVLRWITDRCEGKVPAIETPIGLLPRKQDLDISGLDMDPSTLETLLSIDAGAWRQEVDAISKYLDEYGSRVPSQLREELKGVAKRLEAANAA
ncbi:phosphoenolpyruvate carboxykinase (GTP) [Steroidobacter sp. S1-65]|uniref:Phosphoenolpyruvate carboxykinase [GTP] n=1 Tax=Steroidobacter gossypii TaxID=2805490 RepID=A0ABS1WVQ9_9GAMM|nr:phosphoenolpyruvate carboxykinase (GTP) [Steroidobacter gossypii]